MVVQKKLDTKDQYGRTRTPRRPRRAHAMPYACMALHAWRPLRAHLPGSSIAQRSMDSSQAAGRLWWVYVGTKADSRTGGSSLPVLRFDSAAGDISMAYTDAGCLPAPSWLALTPDARFLYAACRAEDLSADSPTGIGSLDPKDHFVAGFAVDRASGNLRKINEQVSAPESLPLLWNVGISAS
eukprot:SAG11_NODE_2262_length_3608_cov_3.051012_4_plen_183_part_00